MCALGEVPIWLILSLTQVVADNDGPEIFGPDSYENLENTWFALSNLSMRDVDASDRLMPNETVFPVFVMILSCCVWHAHCRLLRRERCPE